MESVSFSEREQHVFNELFSTLDIDNSGKITGSKGLDLLKRSSLPDETIQRIFELSGASRLGHFGRSQFYLALKLVAAAQSGFPLSPDMFKMSSTKSIPLPHFATNTNSTSVVIPSVSSKSSSNSATTTTSLINSSQSPSLITPPSKPSGGRGRNGTVKKPVSSSHMKSLTPSSSPEPGSSPRALADQGWQSFVDEKDEKWTSVSEEGCRLIEGEEDDDDDVDDGTDASDDEEESTLDVWIVSDEQRDYYVKQFFSICSDPQSKVTGPIAKDFFERSKLTTNDLSKIWQLADVDRDGALTLPEFCVAMHLVVLRRNHVDLPRVLPQNLWYACREKTRSIVSSGKSSIQQQQQPTTTESSSSLLNLNSPTHTPTKQQQQQPIQQNQFAKIPQLTTSHSFNNITNHPIPNKSNSHHNLSTDQNWTKFSDSPTSSSNLVVEKSSFFTTSSVGSSRDFSSIQQPANFDFNVSVIESDPKIVHPIPVRATPEAVQLKSLPNPQMDSLTKLAPPPLPSRPHRHGSSGHARSSSLDLNRLGRSTLLDDFQQKFQLPQQHHSMSNCFTSPSPSLTLNPGSTTGITSPSHNVLRVDPSSGTQSHSAFTVYRKTTQIPPPPARTNSPSSSNLFEAPLSASIPSSTQISSLDEMISLLRSKYSLPHESFIPCNPNDPQELLRCLKGLSERNLKIEKLNDRLIQELAQLLTMNQRLEGMMSQLSLGHK